VLHKNILGLKTFIILLYIHFIILMYIHFIILVYIHFFDIIAEKRVALLLIIYTGCMGFLV